MTNHITEGKKATDVQLESTLKITSPTPKENGFFDAELNGQKIELLVGGPPCQQTF